MKNGDYPYDYYRMNEPKNIFEKIDPGENWILKSCGHSKKIMDYDRNSYSYICVNSLDSTESLGTCRLLEDGVCWYNNN